MMTAKVSSESAIAIPPPGQWHPASWKNYITLRDAAMTERMKLAFNQGWLWVNMGGVGINHSYRVSNKYDLQ